MTHLQPFFVPARSRSGASASSAEHALSLLGPSAAMSQLWSQIRRLAPHVRTMLLTGEPDCGQRAVARLLLDLSSHAKRPFLELSAAKAEQCLAHAAGFGSVPSEVFLFLPDVHKLSSAAQDGLLHLIRTRRPRALTVIAATTEELRPMVGMGRFSAELVDCLGSVRLAVPSLRDRREDLPMLLNHMLSSRSRDTGEAVPQMSVEFLRAAMQHDWPGNLRELSAVVDSLPAPTGDRPELRTADLEAAFKAAQMPPGPEPLAARMVPLDTVVQEHIYAVLRACRGNKLRAAEVLGISRSTLYRMLDTSATDLPFSIAS